jgi:integrase/recombinase XerC
MLPSIKIVRLADNRVPGNVIIYLQYTLNRKVNRISLKIKIPKESWQGTDKYVCERGKFSIRNSKNINKFLNETLVKAQNIILNWNEDIPHSFKAFKSKFQRGTPKTFYSYHNLYLQEQRTRPIKKSTFITYNTQMNRINKYQKDLLINEIDRSWILLFHHALIYDFKLDINSIYKVMMHMRAVLRIAVRNNDIPSNPFDDYEIKRVVKEKHFLTKDELKTLERTYEANILAPSLQNVLHYFLFACYTGLSYSDIVKLQFSDIQKTGETYIIKGIRSKSRANNPLKYTIPLIDKAVQLIDFEKEKVVFRAISNQKTNLFIKEICRFVGISKDVTFHTARHTCGTLLLNLGVPRNAVQKILGHNKPETTDHYAKLIDTTLITLIKGANKNWENEK